MFVQIEKRYARIKHYLDLAEPKTAYLASYRIQSGETFGSVPSKTGQLARGFFCRAYPTAERHLMNNTVLKLVSEPAYEREPVEAIFVGSQSCAAGAIKVSSTNSPAFSLCRALIRHGFDEDRPLHLYRDGVLALKITTLRWGADRRITYTRHGRPKWALTRDAVRAQASQKSDQLTLPDILALAA